MFGQSQSVSFVAIISFARLGSAYSAKRILFIGWSGKSYFSRSSGVLKAEHITSASFSGVDALVPGVVHSGTMPALLKTSVITAWAYRTSLAVQTSSEGSLTQSTTRTVSAQSPFHAKAVAITAANPNTADLFIGKNFTTHFTAGQPPSESRISAPLALDWGMWYYIFVHQIKQHCCIR